MAKKNILIKTNNGGAWDELYPITAAGNVKTTDGSDVEAKLDTKVDKVSGKKLSTEDYTTTEKNKLLGIATGANNYTHPSTHPSSMITMADSKTLEQYKSDVSTQLTEKMSKTTTENITGYKGFATGRTGFPTDASGGQAEFRGNGTDGATILLHRPTSFACYLGLDTDNILKIGGYSMGSAKYKILDQRDYDALLQLAGGIMSGALVAQTNANYTTRQVRNVIESTADPSGGANGDIWIKYKP